LNGLVVLGATGEIASNVLGLCFKENTFDKYFLYARNSEKLNKVKEENRNEKIHCITYEMESGYDIAKLSTEDQLHDIEEIILLMIAYTINPIEEIGLFGSERIKKNINVNVFSQVTFIDYFCGMAKKNNIKLKVVFMDSGAAYNPINSWSLYCSSKAYMSMYLRCLQKEQGIPVVLFEPGVIDTSMQKIIRESSCNVFDRVDEFIGYKEKDMLNKPSVVAEQIYKRYLLNWTAFDIKERIET